MTIVQCRRELSGQLLEGYQISCHNTECHGSNFMPSRKHLPDQVVGNKFRERGWEVNASGKDFCPNCLIKKRAPRKPREEKTDRVIPFRDETRLTANNVLKVITTAGLAAAEVVELQDKNRKFRIAFKNPTEFPIGQILHAEGEIVETFKVSMYASYLKIDFTHTHHQGKFAVEAVLYWYLTVQEKHAFAAVG